VGQPQRWRLSDDGDRRNSGSQVKPTLSVNAVYFSLSGTK